MHLHDLPMTFVQALHAQVPVDIPRDQARALAQQELANPRYVALQPSLWQRFTTWLSNELDRVLAASHHGLNTLWAGLVLGLVIVGVVALVLRVLGRPVRSSFSSSQLFTDTDMTAAAHRALADQHAVSGHWDDAVIERMRAIVRELEERAWIDPRPGRTADEAATDGGRALPALAADLVACSRIFDDVCYGKRPATAAHDQRMRAVDDAVRRARESVTA